MPMLIRPSLLLLLVASGPGCAKAHSSHGTMTPDDAGVMASQTDDFGYARPEAVDEDVIMTSDMERESAPSPPRRFARNKSVSKTEISSPAPAADAAHAADTTAHEDPSSGTAEPAVEAPEYEPHDRQIIYTASMRLSVFNLDEATKKAEVLPEGYGGYIHTMSHGHMVMRIPSKNLRPAMEDLAALGIVEHRALQAQDVTAEYVDVDARIRVLEETQKQMVELLAKARTVDEALAVRRALDQITMELEVLKGRMRQLQNMISFSTLTVNLVERGPHVVTPSSRDPFPWVDDLGVEATEWK